MAYTYSKLARGLKPFIVPWIREIIREIAGAGAGNGGGWGGGTAVTTHALNSASHTGTLGDSQAPQFLKTDGTRALTGNLALSTGVAIDGMDPSAHVADADAHHAAATGGDGIDVGGSQVIVVDATDFTDTARGLSETVGLDGYGNIGINLAATSGLEFSSGALAVAAGNGIALDNDEVSVNLASPSGLEFTSLAPYELQIDDALAGDGLNIASKVLYVGAGDGIGVSDNSVAVRLAVNDPGLIVDSYHLRLGTPGTLAVDTTNAVSDQAHSHAVTTDSDVGSAPARAILSSTAAGRLDLATLGLWGNLEFMGGDRYVHGTGNVTLAPTSNLILDPTGTVVLPNAQVMQTVQFDDLVTGITGFDISEESSNVSRLRIGSIKTDALHAKIFVADEVRIDRGSEYWSKSYGIVETDFALPADEGTVDVWFEESPGLGSAALFSTGDWLMLRYVDISTGATLFVVWFEVVDGSASGSGTPIGLLAALTSAGSGGGSGTYLMRQDAIDDHPNRQLWRLTRRMHVGVADAGTIIHAGAVMLDAGQVGQGWVHLSALQADDGPFIQVGKMTTAGTSTSVPVHTNYARFGNLKGVGGIGVDTWGMAAAMNLGTAIGSGYEGFVLDATPVTGGLKLYNTSTQLYKADVRVGYWQPDYLQLLDNTGAVNALTVYTGASTLVAGGKTLATGDVLIGDSTWTNGGYIWYDKSTGNLEVKGSITVVGTIPNTSVSGLGTFSTLSSISMDSSAITSGSTYVKPTAGQAAGGGYAYSGLNSNGSVKSYVKPTVGVVAAPYGEGLYLGSDRMGFYDSVNGWVTYMDNNGKFRFGASSTNYLEWDLTKLRGVGSSVEQWYASASDGKIYAGQGNVILDRNGISLPHTGGVVERWQQISFVSSNVVRSYIRSNDDGLGEWTGLYLVGNGGASLGLSYNVTGAYKQADFNCQVRTSDLVYGLGFYAYYAEAYGYVRVQGQTASTYSGWVGFYTGGGTRLGYIGSSASDMNYYAENGADHVFTGASGAGNVSVSKALTTAGTATFNGHVEANSTLNVDGTATFGSFGGWTAVSLNSGWAHVDPSTYNALAYKIVGNLCFWHGLIKQTTSSSDNIAGAIPSEARPLRQSIHLCAAGATANGATCRIDFTTAGYINLVDAGSGGDAAVYLCLDGIVYEVA